MGFNHYLDTFDLRDAHLVAGILGALLCAYAMQMWNSGLLMDRDKYMTVNGMRRIALWLVAACLLWSVLYADDHPKWQPWAPDLAMIFAVDLFLFSNIVSGYLRRREKMDGSRSATSG